MTTEVMLPDEVVRRLTAAVTAGLQSRDELHDATDQLTEALVQAEQAIAHLGFGVSASVEVPNGSFPWSLRFGRVGRHWKLLAITQDNTTPLVNTSRSMRCEAASLLPTLVEALAEAVHGSTRQVTAALEQVQHFVKVLREMTPPPPENVQEEEP